MDRGELSLSLIIRQVVPYVPSLSLPRFSFFGLRSVHRSGKVNANWRVTLKVGTRKWGKGRRHFAFHSLIFCYTVSTKGICNQRHPIMVCKLCIIMCFIFGSTCKLAWSSLDLWIIHWMLQLSSTGSHFEFSTISWLSYGYGYMTLKASESEWSNKRQDDSIEISSREINTTHGNKSILPRYSQCQVASLAILGTCCEINFWYEWYIYKMSATLKNSYLEMLDIRIL